MKRMIAALALMLCATTAHADTYYVLVTYADGQGGTYQRIEQRTTSPVMSYTLPVHFTPAVRTVCANGRCYR